MTDDKKTTGAPCPHTITTGREGGSGSYCKECGVLIWAVFDRECGDCTSFSDKMKPGGPVGICTKHLMAVSRTMNVTYGVLSGTASPLCFR